MDAEHIGDLAPAVLTARARHALGARVAQAGDQLPAQLPLGWAQMAL